MSDALIIASARISVIASCLVFSFRLISFLCFVAIFAHVMFICILYIGSVRAHFSESSSGLSFCLRLVCFGNHSSILFVFGFRARHIRFVSFFRLFRFAVFLHSSCSVAASYFMLIPLFVILFFQLPCSMFVYS